MTDDELRQWENDRGERSASLGTAQQLAALIVEGDNAFPGPRFVIEVFQHATKDMHARLSVTWQDERRVLCSTRDVATARQFATIDAALREAQRIASRAGREPDHRWTGQAERLPAMPEIVIQVI